MKDHAAIYLLHGVMAVGVDSVYCEDPQALAVLMGGVLEKNETLQYLLKQSPTRRRAALVEAERLERAIAPKRKRDEWVCRGGDLSRYSKPDFKPFYDHPNPASMRRQTRPITLTMVEQILQLVPKVGQK